MPKPPSKYSFIIVSYFSSLVNDKNEKSFNKKRWHNANEKYVGIFCELLDKHVRMKYNKVIIGEYGFLMAIYEK
jgi:hypothetical protein